MTTDPVSPPTQLHTYLKWGTHSLTSIWRVVLSLSYLQKYNFYCDLAKSISVAKDWTEKNELCFPLYLWQGLTIWHLGWGILPQCRTASLKCFQTECVTWASPGTWGPWSWMIHGCTFRESSSAPVRTKKRTVSWPWLGDIYSINIFISSLRLWNTLYKPK